jgi:uncharacterized protein (TIGR02246 family)
LKFQPVDYQAAQAGLAGRALMAEPARTAGSSPGLVPVRNDKTFVGLWWVAVWETAMRSESDERQILELFEDGDRALMAADVAELSRIFADDYVQYDESGASSTKRDVIDRLESGSIRYLSMISTGREIRFLTEDVVTVHGSEDDEVEQEGKRFTVQYIYMDVVMKRDGRWQIVGSQLARPS